MVNKLSFYSVNYPQLYYRMWPIYTADVIKEMACSPMFVHFVWVIIENVMKCNNFWTFRSGLWSVEKPSILQNRNKVNFTKISVTNNVLELYNWTKINVFTISVPNDTLSFTFDFLSIEVILKIYLYM